MNAMDYYDDEREARKEIKNNTISDSARHLGETKSTFKSLRSE